MRHPCRIRFPVQLAGTAPVAVPQGLYFPGFTTDDASGDIRGARVDLNGAVRDPGGLDLVEQSQPRPGHSRFRSGRIPSQLADHR